MQALQTWIDQELPWHITHNHQNDIGIIDVSNVSVPKTFVIKREFVDGDKCKI